MHRHLVCCGILIALGGCGAAPNSMEPPSMTSLSEKAFDFTTKESMTLVANETSSTPSSAGSTESTDQVVSATGPVASIERKIIYTANISMSVDEVAPVNKQIRAMLKEHGGYLSNYSERKIYNDRLQACWVLRVPTAAFSTFLEELDALGQTDSLEQNSQDVTEEFVDLERRLQNKQRLEERILKLLEEQTGEIKDVLEVETQLARVREDIERMEGRLNYLKEMTSMTTITVTAEEKDEYVPAEVAGFGTRINNTFFGSLDNLGAFFQGFVIAATAAAPWLVVFGIPLFSVVLFWRGRRRRARAH